MKYIISAPSGTGKTTVIDGLLEKSQFILSKSHTTRQPRTDDCFKEYNFCSRKEFQKLKDRNFFLETEEVFSNFYGTPREYAKKEETVVFNVDVKGALKLKSLFPARLILLFVPPKVLEERLVKRGEKDVEKRLSAFAQEIGNYKSFDFCVENSILEDTISYVQRIIEDRVDEEVLKHDKSCREKISWEIRNMYV